MDQMVIRIFVMLAAFLFNLAVFADTTASPAGVSPINNKNTAASAKTEATKTAVTDTTKTTRAGETADTNSGSDEPSVNPDPYEKFNRAMFTFNDMLDKAALKPVATLYNKIIPKPIVKGVSNIFSNIDTIPTVFNDALQGNIYQTTSDAWRLTINSTIGLLGFFDPATSMGLEPNKEDFGLTLAQWGYKNSNYLVLPFFGPSTTRDGIGLPVDYYAFSIYPRITPTIRRYELYGVGVVSKRADLLHFENVMEEASLDRYVFLRDAYLQRRKYLIQRNKELGDPYLEKNNKNDTGTSL